MKNYKDLLIKILIKKAKGYSYKEKTDEYSVVDGVETLLKRKVTTKKMQPDISAAKALLEISDSNLEVDKMTDEQLQVEKLRLIRLLNACDSTLKSDELYNNEED